MTPLITAVPHRAAVILFFLSAGSDPAFFFLWPDYHSALLGSYPGWLPGLPLIGHYCRYSSFLSSFLPFFLSQTFDAGSVLVTRPTRTTSQTSPTRTTILPHSFLSLPGLSVRPFFVYYVGSDPASLRRRGLHHLFFPRC